jgi:hypothetical protein
MVDLSNLTNEQLDQLYQQKKGESPSPSSGADLSKLSDEDLDKLYQSKKTNWSDIPVSAATHFLPDVGYQISGMAQQAYGTAKTIAPYVAKWGPLAPTAMAIDAGKAIENDPSILKTIPMSVWRDLKEHYGSMENIKHTMATEPARFLMDAWSLAEGGAGLARGGAGIARDIAGIPRTPPPVPPVMPPPIPTPRSEAAEAAQRLGLPIPRAITSESAPARIMSQVVAKLPWIGTPVREAVQAVPSQMAGKVEEMASGFGPKQPVNIVGGGIQQTLGEAGRAEAAQAAAKKTASDKVAKAAIKQRNEAEKANWERDNQEREAAIRDVEVQSHQNAERVFGNVHPTEMADRTINEVQQAHNEARAADQANWEQVRNLNAPTSQRALDNLHGDIDQGLARRGVTISAETTPNARRMMQEVERLTPGAETPATPPTNIHPRVMSALEREYGVGNVPDEAIRAAGGTPGTPEIPGTPPDFRLMGAHAPAPGDTHITAQGWDALRKRIGDMAYNAQTPEDMRASNAVKHLFEQKIADAFDNHLLPGGDPNANQTIRDAVAGHRAFKERFGYNYENFPSGTRRQAASELNQMATGNAGPTNIAGKMTNHEVSHELLQSISGAVRNPGAVRDRLRGAIWRETNTGTSQAVANKIADLRVSPIGRELFTPAELDQMHQHGSIRQQAEVALKRSADIAKENKPKPIKFKAEPLPLPGKAETLAKKVLGYNRGEEQIYGAVDQFAKNDPKNFARTWGRMTDANRKEFTASWLRRMGGEGEAFNPTEFVKNWESYSDQAKAVMLDRGHRQTMNDIATNLREYGDNIKKYGNPSGTAQATMYQKILFGGPKAAATLVGAGALHALGGPVGVLLGGLGARKFSLYMASPERAQQIARWTRLAKAYQKAPSPGALNVLVTLTRNLHSQKD